MRTFLPDRTCWSLLLTALAIRLRNKPTYDKLQVLIINKDVRKSLARKNGNENPIWIWNDSISTEVPAYSKKFPWKICIPILCHVLSIVLPGNKSSRDRPPGTYPLGLFPRNTKFSPTTVVAQENCPGEQNSLQ